MIGAIAGDIIGSAYEANAVKTADFDLFSPGSRFTDDTVLTVAVADCILHGKDYGRTYKEYGLRYPDAGYGSFFIQWLQSDNPQPYNSFGNGSAMRVSPIGFACTTLDSVMNEAERSAEVTHNHPEGIKGAQAVAGAVYLAVHGYSKDAIRSHIEETFSYDLSRSLDDIRPGYIFDMTCQGSVPEAIIAFLESNDYEDAVRNAISLGGDSDTQACIAGGIAQAFYRQIPESIINQVRKILPKDLLDVVDEFNGKYRLKY